MRYVSFRVNAQLILERVQSPERVQRVQRDMIILFGFATLLWLRLWLARPAIYLEKAKYY